MFLMEKCAYIQEQQLHITTKSGEKIIVEILAVIQKKAPYQSFFCFRQRLLEAEKRGILKSSMYLLMLKLICIFFFVLSAISFITMLVLHTKMLRHVIDALAEKKIKPKWWWNIPSTYRHVYPDDKKTYVIYSVCFYLFIIFVLIGTFINGKIITLDRLWWL